MSEEVLLSLGDYQFGMSTAAHDSLQRSDSYRWVTQYRLGRDPALQYVGPGQRTMKLSGSIYPHFRGGLEQLDDMREEAEKAEALTLVDGRGNNLGTWVIKKISETETTYVRDGIPKRINFNRDLEKYGDDGVNQGGDGGGDSGSGGGVWDFLSLFA